MTLQVRGITKCFGPVLANDSVDVELEPGALHAVLGENGAGKSTLMKILSGFLTPDSGSISYDGAVIPSGDPRAALAAGIGMLHQEPLVCLPFTVLENFRLGSNRATAESEGSLRELAGRFSFRLEPQETTRSLSVGSRQQLEIVRLLDRGVRVLILDEPTTGISAGQREALFSTLRILAGEGLIVLFVSHKLEEVNALCSDVMVMRRGRVVGRRSLPAPSEELVGMMFEQVTPYPSRAGGMVRAETVAAWAGVEAGVGRGAITGVDLEVRAGEVVGIAGMEGSGQVALLRSMAGLLPVETGRLLVNGVDLEGRPHADFAAAGVGFLPAGRLEEGLLPGLDLSEHLELAAPTGGRLVDWPGASQRAASVIERFRIKGRPGSVVESLSGGNQQRLLLAMLPPGLRLLLMEHPTRGLDLESAAFVWEQLLARRAEGTGIVFASSDLDELMAYSDRVVVCFDGRIIADLEREEADAEQIARLIGGMAAA